MTLDRGETVQTVQTGHGTGRPFRWSSGQRQAVRLIRNQTAVGVFRWFYGGFRPPVAKIVAPGPRFEGKSAMEVYPSSQHARSARAASPARGENGHGIAPSTPQSDARTTSEENHPVGAGRTDGRTGDVIANGN